MAIRDREEAEVAYMTPRNLAKLHPGISERQIREWMDRPTGSLPWIQCGGTRKVDEDDLRRYIEQVKVRR